MMRATFIADRIVNFLGKGTSIAAYAALLALGVFCCGCCHPMSQHRCNCGAHGCSPGGADVAGCPLHRANAGFNRIDVAQVAAMPGRFHPVPTRPVFGVDPSVGRPLEEMPRPVYRAPAGPTPEQELRMLPDPDAAARAQKKEDDAIRDEATPYGGNFLPGNLVP